MVEEARLEQSELGLEPVTDGWFTVNVREAAWLKNDAMGAAACIFEGDRAPFAEIGYTLSVMWPGRTGGMYHREGNQEDFLVLMGECTLLIEGEERHLRAWDFVHCPRDTEHIIIGAGDGPCVVFMIGGRTRPKDIVYPRSELALRHRAGVERETTESSEAYAAFPKWQPGATAEAIELLSD
jgi:uncharacterized cupin superfamily protein